LRAERSLRKYDAAERVVALTVPAGTLVLLAYNPQMFATLAAALLFTLIASGIMVDNHARRERERLGGRLKATTLAGRLDHDAGQEEDDDLALYDKHASRSLSAAGAARSGAARSGSRGARARPSSILSSASSRSTSSTASKARGRR
jgi:hypothetical protein